MTTPRGRGDAPIEAPAGQRLDWAEITEEHTNTEGTEGREAVARWMIAHGYATGHGDTLDDLLTELVAAARDEGSQEAVRRIEAIDHPCHDVCIGNLHADCQCAAWIRQEAISAVAGLNASEPLPTRYGFDPGHPDGDRTVEIPVGDTSESGQQEQSDD